MSRLAIEGGGHFYFIEQPAQIADVLTSELGDTLDVVARDARVVFSGEPGVSFGCFNHFPTETIHDPVTGRDDMHVRLGDLVSGQDVAIAVAAGCPARPAGGQVAIGVRLTDRDSVLFPQPLPIEWEAVDGAANAALRVLGAGIREVDALASELDGGKDEFTAPLAPLAVKARHFASYSLARSRGPAGKARKRVS
jgi:hypothetical protein